MASTVFPTPSSPPAGRGSCTSRRPIRLCRRFQPHPAVRQHRSLPFQERAEILNDFMGVRRRSLHLRHPPHEHLCCPMAQAIDFTSALAIWRTFSIRRHRLRVEEYSSSHPKNLRKADGLPRVRIPQGAFIPVAPDGVSPFDISVEVKPSGLVPTASGGARCPISV